MDISGLFILVALIVISWFLVHRIEKLEEDVRAIKTELLKKVLKGNNNESK